jgi:transcriptional regulator with XRE-family HTH domain
MTPQEVFVTRLRRQRERYQVSLEQMASETRVKPELLEALERNDLSGWPRGLYARAWIRAYATAVGMDPVQTVNEFCRLFPHGDRRTGATIQSMATSVGTPPAYRDEIDHEDRRRRPPEVQVVRKPSWHAVLAAAGRNVWLRLNSMRPSPALREDS